MTLKEEMSELPFPSRSLSPVGFLKKKTEGSKATMIERLRSILVALLAFSIESFRCIGSGTCSGIYI